ncbi:hypothetical protein [Nonomuraea dietziae]|uniref:hypothetical protein n=1 Tax=Nonomuraea dietziae TaxID=65515 RepID=UPI0031DDAC57
MGVLVGRTRATGSGLSLTVADASGVWDGSSGGSTTASSVSVCSMGASVATGSSERLEAHAPPAQESPPEPVSIQPPAAPITTTAAAPASRSLVRLRTSRSGARAVLVSIPSRGSPGGRSRPTRP